jgi:hypothetical protein
MAGYTRYTTNSCSQNSSNSVGRTTCTSDRFYCYNSRQDKKPDTVLSIKKYCYCKKYSCILCYYYKLNKLYRSYNTPIDTHKYCLGIKPNIVSGRGRDNLRKHYRESSFAPFDLHIPNT